MRALTVALVFLIPFSLYASARSNSGGLAERVTELEAQVGELSAILEFVYVETEKIDGLRGPHWIIEGANVHVRSGIGSTYSRLCPAGRPGCVSSNGLGNLIVGYNEVPPSQPFFRHGMHNLVVGPEHDWDADGGFIAGRQNSVNSQSASVSGGLENQANATNSSVSGGRRNMANASFASVSGGQDRVALEPAGWVAGSLSEPN